MSQFKTILVTGGCGFIGSNFVEYVNRNASKTKVIIVDKLTYAGDMHNIAGLDYNFYNGDICNYDYMKYIFTTEKIDAIVNFAAESHVDNSIDSANEFIQTNIVGTSVLLSLARSEKIKRFLQVSTDEVYGSLGHDCPPSKEGDPIITSSPYSASKASADCLVTAYNKTHKLDTIITRCSNNYGPKQNKEKLIPLMISKALNSEALPVYGNGSNIRDWIHVEDHCKGIYLALTEGQSGETYNFGGKNQTTNLSLATKILHALNKPIDLIQFVEDRKGHDFRYDIDCSKARSQLGWHPDIPLRDGFNRTIEWYKDNENKSK
jgi:dTDP-glucose 4,6-dehydratase